MIAVRRADIGDASAVADAERKYIDCPWTKEQIEREISDGASVFLVAEDDGAFCGYLSGTVAADECEISNIAVEFECRRRGIGTMLFETLLSEIRSRGVNTVFLLVRSDNVSALALYGKLGFARVGSRRGYYKNGDAVIMRLDL